MSVHEPYLDDSTLLVKYRAMVASMVSAEVARLRGFSFVASLEDPLCRECDGAIEATQHGLYRDLDSDALYQAACSAVVTWCGRVLLYDLHVEPAPATMLPRHITLPWEEDGIYG